MATGENTLQTVETAFQDIVAPELRELKVKVETMKEELANVKTQIASLDERTQRQFTSLERRMDDKFVDATARSEAQFQAILAAIGRSTAENELMVYKQVSALAQRVSVLEARLPQPA